MLRKILKKVLRFLLINIDGEMTDVSLLEMANDGGGVKNSAAAGVNQKYPLFHKAEGLLIDKMPGRRKQRDMKGNDVGLAEEILLRDEPAELGGIGVG